MTIHFACFVGSGNLDILSDKEFVKANLPIDYTLREVDAGQKCVVVLKCNNAVEVGYAFREEGHVIRFEFGPLDQVDCDRFCTEVAKLIVK